MGYPKISGQYANPEGVLKSQVIDNKQLLTGILGGNGKPSRSQELFHVEQFRRSPNPPSSVLTRRLLHLQQPAGSPQAAVLVLS